VITPFLLRQSGATPKGPAKGEPCHSERSRGISLRFSLLLPAFAVQVAGLPAVGRHKGLFAGSTHKVIISQTVKFTVPKT
jgi:hypothetical protein